MARYAHAVFCDDVRQEVGGKITLVGMYAGQCLVPAIPCSLPKLCMALSISATRANPIQSVSVTGAFAGSEVLNMILDKDQIDGIMTPAFSAKPEGKNMMIFLMAVMAPFNVSTEGKLTITVTADGEEMYCEGLEISLAAPGTTFGF